MIKKRFKLTNPTNSFQNMKCGINDGNKKLTFNEVIDLLNEFYENNKQLKHWNRCLAEKRRKGV